jgi:predicted regulator of Ras-like GTPase activity (Roadblock/LC7/MglB family)
MHGFMSDAARDFNWLVSKFVDAAPGVTDALVLSSDGLPMAVSPGLTSDMADRLAAVASGLVGLANGVALPFGAGRVTQVVVELERAFVFVTGVSDGSSLAVLAKADCDVGLVAYEMGVLVDRAAAMLTPALRVELQAALAR